MYCTHTIYASFDDLRVRKEIKIRPGFTPQEDVSRFRGTRQQQFERTQLPKGHILGWVPPSSETNPKKKAATTGPSGAPLSKSAKKREKAKEKKKEEKERIIKDSWEDDDDDVKVWPTPDTPNKEKDTAKELEETKAGDDKVDALADQLESTAV